MHWPNDDGLAQGLKARVSSCYGTRQSAVTKFNIHSREADNGE